VDPTALVEAIYAANAERTAARAELANLPMAQTLSEEATRWSSRSATSARRCVAPANEDLVPVYQGLRLQVRYEPPERVAIVSRSNRVWLTCVSEGDLHTNHTPRGLRSPSVCSRVLAALRR
jgi:hypothetical protein